MRFHPTPPKPRAVKTLAAIGVGSFVTLGALSAAYAGVETGIENSPEPALAKSGHEANPVPTQPVVGQMDFGATEIWTTPSDAPQVTEARPAVKAN
jgi:hypothetical protein